MQWMVPERRLDEYQRDILSKCGQSSKKNDWIQGFAGSGKTVLLVHLVQKYLVNKPDARVCVVVFTHALKDLIGTGFEDKMKIRVPVMTYHRFLSDSKNYDLVILDEVQDIPNEKLAAINALAERVIVAGDVDQSIYENSSSEDEINSVLEPRTHKLIVLYRLAQKLRDIVQSILPNSQIESAKSGRMQDVQVTLANAATKDEEIEWVWEACCRKSSQGDPAVILLPSHKDIQNFIASVCRIEGADLPDFMKGRGGRDYAAANAHLSDAGIPLQYLGNSFGQLTDSDTQPLTYVMTYHSAKGLDFDTVFLPHLNQGQTFWRDDEVIDRRVFFVGATRSRKNLLLSYSSSEPHEYVKAMPQNLLHKEKCEVRKIEDSMGQEMFF